MDGDHIAAWALAVLALVCLIAMFLRAWWSTRLHDDHDEDCIYWTGNGPPDRRSRCGVCRPDSH